jgi:nucleotide-binding universal stress UspA family protein
MFDDVIIGVDRYPGGQDAIALGRRLAAPGAKITLARVFGTGGMVGSGGALGLEAERQAAELELAQTRQECAIDAELTVIMGPNVGRALHQLARSGTADLLVVGSCHRGPLGRVLVGNDALATLNGSPCAVAIAPSGFDTDGPKLSTVGVGVDESLESARAVEVARELGGRLGAVVRARSVVSLQEVPSAWGVAPPDWVSATEQRIAEERARLKKIDGVEADVLFGKADEQLTELSREVDLLVVGSRGAGPLRRLIDGSTSNHLAHHVGCPLLVVPLTEPAEAKPLAASASVPERASGK